MAMGFDGTERKTFDATGLVMPAAATPWVVGILVNVTGGASKDFIVGCYNPSGSEGAYNGWSLIVLGTGAYRVWIPGDGGTGFQMDSTNTPGSDDTDRLIVIQNNTTASEFEFWMCDAGGTAVKENSTSNTGFLEMSESWPAYVGGNADTTAGEFLQSGSKVGEFWRGDGFFLTQAQIEGLAAGYLHPQFLGHDLTFYHPMRDVADTMVDRRGNYDLTGAGVGATAAHFTVFQRDR